jgi:hypothetical protein
MVGRGRDLPRAWRWLPHVLIGLSAVPFVVHQNAWYEWANPYWQLELQTAHVRAFGTPTYFIHADGMLFYPIQVFYAGPILALLAYPSVLIGAWPVFAFTTVAAFCALSAGASWIARNLGVSRDLAVIPGLLLAATPYLVSNLYGRGAWAELVAVAALAVGLGAGTSLVFGRARSTIRAMLVVALASAVVAGTHNITLLFGGIFGVAVAVVLLPLAGLSRWRGYALALVSAGIGVALCGAFLLPDAWLSGREFVEATSPFFITQLHGYDRLGLLFDPLAGQPAAARGSDARAQTLVAASAWCVVALAVVLWQRWLDRRAALSLTGLVLIVVAALIVIVNPGWWAHFPAQFQAIQFPFRLLSYVALGTVLLIALLLSRSEVSGNRPLVAGLGVAVVLQLALAGVLAASATPLPTSAHPVTTASDIRADSVPPAFAYQQELSYRIVEGTQVPVPKSNATVSPVGDDSPNTVRLSGRQAVGTLVGTDIVNSPLIRITGSAARAAITPVGLIVLRPTQTPWHVTVTPRCSACLSPGGGTPAALWLGRWASIGGALALLVLLGLAGRERWPRPRDGQPAPGS